MTKSYLIVGFYESLNLNFYTPWGCLKRCREYKTTGFLLKFACRPLLRNLFNKKENTIDALYHVQLIINISSGIYLTHFLNRYSLK